MGTCIVCKRPPESSDPKRVDFSNIIMSRTLTSRNSIDLMSKLKGKNSKFSKDKLVLF